MYSNYIRQLFLTGALPVLLSCGGREDRPPDTLVQSIDLKRGPLITCGPQQQFGTVAFEMTGPSGLKKDFELGLQLLHSFEYDEAEKVFARIIDAQPGFAMGYWGVAMSNFHPLWAPPSGAELEKGAKATQIAQRIGNKSEREGAYISAISAFYTDWERVPHKDRCRRFEKAMEAVYTAYPGDREAAVFYALSLVAAADPTDKTYQRQKKAGDILKGIYPGAPHHPGVVHYLIHAYDSPGLAELGLPAARRYASVAPSSAHALHMPSHIFTRMGFWDECIQSNLASVAAAQCYAEAAGMEGHWDEELHGIDYLVYAYLQQGNNAAAKKYWDYLNSMKTVHPVNFKVAYAFAAVPARYLLENRMWEEAARLEVPPRGFAWKDFPWQRAMIHFTRALGAVHTGNRAAAGRELGQLEQLQQAFTAGKKDYEANLVQVQVATVRAWILLGEGEREAAVRSMTAAAEREDRTEKLPVTPGDLLPARELLGDMFLQLGDYANALKTYEAGLALRPRRFNSLYGAAVAAQKGGNAEKAASFYRQLIEVAGNGSSSRPEVAEARSYLNL